MLKYSNQSRDVAQYYRQLKRLIDLAKSEQILYPRQETIPLAYLRDDFDVSQFHEIVRYVSLFNMYMDGFESEEEFNMEIDRALENEDEITDHKRNGAK